MVKGSYKKGLYFISLFFLFYLFSKPLITVAQSRIPPYPPSETFAEVLWDYAGMKSAAPGSDLWPVTWANDNELYTSWGDGGGFGGSNIRGRVSIGVARIRGDGDNWNGCNIWGGNKAQVASSFIGKSTGIISIGNVLYLLVTKQSTWDYAKVCSSHDYARNWSCTGWDYPPPFQGGTYLNFGKDYDGARDDYAYHYNTVEDKKHIVLSRVPVERIKQYEAYEFFAGPDENNKLIWDKNITRLKPIFTDPNGVGWGVQVMYNPVLKRYLLTVRHDDTGGWGIFDAAEPWGPWTTVAYYDNWLDSKLKFSFVFNQKWLGKDGLTMWMIFSGIEKYDSFNVIKATFSLKRSN